MKDEMFMFKFCPSADTCSEQTFTCQRMLRNVKSMYRHMIHDDVMHEYVTVQLNSQTINIPTSVG